MKVGIFAKTFADSTPLEVFRKAAAAGYMCVQYNMACSGIGALPERIEMGIAEAARDAAAATKIEISAVSATYNMIHPDRNVRAAGRHSFAALAAAAPVMGARLLTVCSGSLDAGDQWRHHPDNGGDTAWAEMMKEFGVLLRIAEDQDILIGVEPELANVVSSARKARTLIDTLGSDRIRIVFDAANLFENEDAGKQRKIIDESIDLVGDRIAIAHAKDRNAQGHFVAAGKGVIDYGHYLAALGRAGFPGPLIAHGLAADEAAGVSRFLKKSLSQAVSAA